MLTQGLDLLDSLDMKEQFNFSLSVKEARPLLSEAKRRGMTDKAGNINRAMIARALVLERMQQLRPPPASENAELQAAIEAAGGAHSVIHILANRIRPARLLKPARRAA